MNTISKSFAILTAIFTVFVIFGTVWAADLQPVDINTASVQELAQLKGVGPAYAAKIVEYRQANGPFVNAEDITNVRGIGAKTFEVNKDRITVQKPAKQ